MAIYFHQTSQFDETRSQIEEHLYDAVLSVEKNIDLALKSVDQFAKSIDRLMDTLEKMYQNPQPNDILGEKSFPIREGRYRVFFKISVRPNHDFDITFVEIDDNKQSNLDRFPAHLITFDDES